MLSLGSHVSLPVHERVVDRLADLLFAADEALDILRNGDARRFAWVETQIQDIYDTVNCLLKTLCD